MQHCITVIFAVI